MTHDEARALIAEGRAHDEAMCGGKWRAFGIGSILEVESSELHPDGCNIGVAEDMRADDARGIAWMRNNLARLLTGYAEVLEEIERLRPVLVACESAYARAHEPDTEGPSVDCECETCCAVREYRRVKPLTATPETASDLEEIRLNERCGPMFDLFLRFEEAFARLAIDRLDITDEDAEAFAVIMAVTDAGSAFAYLMRHIRIERVLRRMAHMAGAVLESRKSAGIDSQMISLSELGDEFDKLQEGST